MEYLLRHLEDYGIWISKDKIYAFTVKLANWWDFKFSAIGLSAAATCSRSCRSMLTGLDPDQIAIITKPCSIPPKQRPVIMVNHGGKYSSPRCLELIREICFRAISRGLKVVIHSWLTKLRDKIVQELVNSNLTPVFTHGTNIVGACCYLRGKDAVKAFLRPLFQ